MDTESRIANTIRNILKQVNSTTISAGKLEGHFVSTAQVAVLEECADTLENLESVAGVNTPTSSQVTRAASEEDAIRTRRLQVAHELKQKQVQLALATASDRTAVNNELGKLLSERARLDKLIKRLDAVNLH